MADEFLTVPEELIRVAQDSAAHLRSLGYKVSIEPRKLAHPYMPALTARRQTTTMILEVVGDINMRRIEEWVAFSKSCSSDTRFAVALDQDSSLAQADLMSLAELKVGVLVRSDQGVQERLPPADLTVDLSLPELGSFSRCTREALGEAFEEFSRNRWKDGFDKACQAVERESRKYLERHVGRGRIVFSKPNGTGVEKVSGSTIRKSTLGQLGQLFERILAPTHNDSTGHTLISELNPDRVRSAHNKQDGRREARLRRVVGQQMWAITKGIDILCNE